MDRADADWPWWRDAVVYQIYTRSFLDTDGDGVGDLEGGIAKLDYLANLGVDILWLSPVHPTLNVDNGYDVADYRAVDPATGSLETFDRLVEDARERGMKIMMDFVLNHSSEAHPWFLSARSSRTSPYYDYYIWKDGLPDRPPNDWPAAFNEGPAWTYNITTRSWYLHLFTRAQPDLNWENPKLRAELYDAMRFWLDRGVAGVRLDVIGYLSKPAGYPNLPEEYAKRPYGFYASGPNLVAYLQEMRREVFDHYDMVALGEGFGVTPAQALDLVGPQARALDLMFLFDLSWLARDAISGRPALADVRRVLGGWDDALVPGGAWPTLFLSNHDVPRGVSRFANPAPEHREAAAKLLATLLLTLRGTPVIYQGDEIGMANTPFDRIEEYRDIAALYAWRDEVRAGRDPAPLLERLARHGRDTGRTPVHWNAGANAGFTEGEPWIKVSPDHATVNVAAQEGDPDSVLEHHRHMLRLRRHAPALRRGSLRWRDEHPQVLAYEREADGDRWLLLLNWSDMPVEYPVEDVWTCVVGNPESLTLGPWESRVLRCGRGL